MISGLFVGQYLQRVTSNLALGGELLYQYGPQVPGGEISILSLAGRLTGKLSFVDLLNGQHLATFFSLLHFSRSI